MTFRPARRWRAAAAVGVAALALAGCSGPDESANPATEPTPDAVTSSAPEVANARLGITYDGGVMIVEEETMKHVADLPLAGFLRLNPAGDQRHLLVSTGEGFQVLDTGVEVRGHDDHFHLYGHEPRLTDTVFAAPQPGHAVLNAGRLALFSDGAGTVQVLDAAEVTEGPDAATTTQLGAHHGVAVPTEDGGLIVSLDDRTGINVLDADGHTLATSTECPSLHGEAAAHEAITFGCADGTLIVKGDQITKVPSSDAEGQLSTQVGSPESDVVLSDYSVGEEATGPSRIALVDTADASISLVELPAGYTFRSLGRGPEGEALVLTTDGNLLVIDAGSGEITQTIAVTQAWEEPENWQQARPTLRVVGNIAYVTEPASGQLHAVHLPSARLVDSVTLPQVPNEIQDVLLGDGPSSHEGHDHAEDDHDHEDHDHS